MANPVRAAQPAMATGRLGYIDTPAQGNRRPNSVTWMADNGCFGKGYPGDTGYLTWLTRNAHAADQCLFATAPDVVGDAQATLTRSEPMLPKIRALGYRAALVAQDGLEHLNVPWETFDAFFIGGTTTWKLGPTVRDLVIQARAHGKWVHMGRVNSARRYRYAQSIGCHSADGTYAIFGPEKNVPKLLTWDQGPGLFTPEQLLAPSEVKPV